jgi:hypothetical protein
MPFFRKRLSKSQSNKQRDKIAKKSFLLSILPEIINPKKRNALKNHDFEISQAMMLSFLFILLNIFLFYTITIPAITK